MGLTKVFLPAWIFYFIVRSPIETLKFRSFHILISILIFYNFISIRIYECFELFFCLKTYTIYFRDSLEGMPGKWIEANFSNHDEIRLSLKKRVFMQNSLNRVYRSKLKFPVIPTISLKKLVLYYNYYILKIISENLLIIKNIVGK